MWKMTTCQTFRKFWHLELFWRDLHLIWHLVIFLGGPVKKTTLYFFLCLPKLKFEAHCIVCGMPVSKLRKCRNSSWHYMIKEYVPRSVALLASSYSDLSYRCTKSYFPHMLFLKWPNMVTRYFCAMFWYQLLRVFKLWIQLCVTSL